jgi:serine/threonine protein kinase
MQSSKKVLYAPSELDRDEWVAVIRKYSAQSNIENGYEFTRDNSSKLGEGKLFTCMRKFSQAYENVHPSIAGSFGTVFKGKDRATGKIWALKEIPKASVNGEDLVNLKVEIFFFEPIPYDVIRYCNAHI